jgi:hypothetical protein
VTCRELDYLRGLLEKARRHGFGHRVLAPSHIDGWHLRPGGRAHGLVSAREAHRAEPAEPVVGALGLAIVEQRAAGRVAVEQGQAIVPDRHPFLLGVPVLHSGGVHQADHAVARARDRRCQVHELAHRGMRAGGGLGDDRTSIRVAAEQDGWLEPIEQLAHRSGVRIEVGPGAVLADRRQLDGYRLEPLLLEQGHHVGPHPGSRKAAGHQHDSGISCGHILILTPQFRASA